MRETGKHYLKRAEYKEEIKRKAAEIRERITGKAARVTFEEVYILWMNALYDENLEWDKVGQLQSVCTVYFLPEWNNRFIDEIDEDEINRVMREITVSSDIGKRYKQTVCWYLFGLFRFAEEEAFIAKNPADSKLIREMIRNGSNRELSPEEAERIREYIDSKDGEEYDSLKVMMHTGIMLGELVLLKKTDIDPASGTITVRERVKDMTRDKIAVPLKESRRIRMDGTVAEILARRFANREQYVEGGPNKWESHVYKQFKLTKAAAKELGIPTVTPALISRLSY